LIRASPSFPHGVQDAVRINLHRVAWLAVVVALVVSPLGRHLEWRAFQEDEAAKKVLAKDVIEKAMAAYAQGDLNACEVFARWAMELDPEELAAQILAFKARAERRYAEAPEKVTIFADPWN
jgi:hypothetical protein